MGISVQNGKTILEYRIRIPPLSPLSLGKPVVETGKQETVDGLKVFEARVGAANVKLSMFRGVETLIEPDQRRLVS